MTFLNMSQGNFKLFLTEAKICAFRIFITTIGEALKSERKEKRKKFPLPPHP